MHKGVAQFELKKICEAERKRKERKARAKDSSPDSAQSELNALFTTDSLELKLAYLSHQRMNI